MTELATCGRFALASKLLGSKVKASVVALVDALVAQGAVDEANADHLRLTYGVS
jgi:hypothetical protein